MVFDSNSAKKNESTMQIQPGKSPHRGSRVHKWLTRARKARKGLLSVFFTTLLMSFKGTCKLQINETHTISGTSKKTNMIFVIFRTVQNRIRKM